MTEDQRDEQETERRRDEALRRALQTPPKPHKQDEAAKDRKRSKREN